MGFNYRMTNIEAALGLAQMDKVNTFLGKKKVFKERYQKTFRDLPFVTFQQEYQGVHSSWWLTCIMVSGNIEVDQLVTELGKRNIQSRRAFWPIDQMPYLRSFSKSCPNSYNIYQKLLCLPSSTVNTEDDIDRVASEIREVLLARSLHE
ncbi:MAG: DegT/DnrJ/EryC1/StrS family aminotransferase, partial [Planctomycetota bacterium]|nr:DegT/DnrJ/EryC1/StrS family aminotransferase [Planctomycetota bacterium]